MRTVKNKNELKKNFKTLDNYIVGKKDPKYYYALKLIEKGTCFIAVKISEDDYKFYPSRFVGYFENSMDKHENNFEKDGRITNAAINKILCHKPEENSKLNFKYKEYCEKLGFIAKDKGSFVVKRKFWEFN